MGIRQAGLDIVLACLDRLAYEGFLLNLRPRGRLVAVRDSLVVPFLMELTLYKVIGCYQALPRIKEGITKDILRQENHL